MERVLKSMPAVFSGQISRLMRRSGEPALGGHSAVMAFAIRVCAAALMFAIQIFLARWLGEEQFGVFTGVWVWIIILGTLAPLGFPTAVIRFLPHYVAQDNKRHFKGLLWFGAAISVLSASLIGAVLVWPLLHQWLMPDNYIWPMLILFFALPAFSLSDFQDGVGRSQGWVDAALVPPYIVRPLLAFFIIGILHWVWAVPVSAMTAAIATVAAAWVSVVVQHLWERHRFGDRLARVSPAWETSLWMRTALPLVLLDGFTLMMFNLDVLMLQHYVSPEKLGVYYVAVKIISLVSFVHFSVGAVAGTRFSTLIATGRVAELPAALRTMKKWTFLPSAAATFIILILGKPLLALFGSGYGEAWGLMAVLALGLLVRGWGGPAQSLLVVSGKQNRVAAILCITVLVNIALFLVLVPRFGLYGAAMSTTAAFTLDTLLTILEARRTTARLLQDNKL